MLYKFLWRLLPDILFLRVFIFSLAFGVTVIVLFTWVFPWIANVLGLDVATMA